MRKAGVKRSSNGRLGNRRGQSFLEYIVILGVVIVLIVAFANGAFRTGMNNTLTSSVGTLNSATKVMNTGANALNNARNW